MPQLKCFCMNRDMENTTITTIPSHYTGSLIVLPMDDNLMIIPLNQVRSHSPPNPSPYFVLVLWSLPRHQVHGCWPGLQDRSMGSMGWNSESVINGGNVREYFWTPFAGDIWWISGEYLGHSMIHRIGYLVNIWWRSDDWSFIHHPCFSTNSFSAFPPYLHLPHLSPIWAFLKDQAKRFLWLCLNIARLSYTISTIHTHTRKYIYIYIYI
jgi:hypothetical protein